MTNVQAFERAFGLSKLSPVKRQRKGIRSVIDHPKHLSNHLINEPKRVDDFVKKLELKAFVRTYVEMLMHGGLSFSLIEEDSVAKRMSRSF